MRITIETNDSGQVSLSQQEQSEAQSMEFMDAGAPSEELMAALGEASADAPDFEEEPQAELESESDDSTFH